MKNFIFIIFVGLLMFICCENTPMNKQYGMVNNVEQIVRYDPVVHMMKYSYKTTVSFEDTTFSFISIRKYNVGDTITIYNRYDK